MHLICKSDCLHFADHENVFEGTSVMCRYPQGSCQIGSPSQGFRKLDEQIDLGEEKREQHGDTRDKILKYLILKMMYCGILARQGVDLSF